MLLSWSKMAPRQRAKIYVSPRPGRDFSLSLLLLVANYSIKASASGEPLN